MTDKLNRMKAEAAIQHAIKEGWKPAASLGDHMGDVIISLIEVPEGMLNTISLYIPDIKRSFDAALHKAVEELDLFDTVIGCEWSNHGAEIVTRCIRDRIQDFNRKHKNSFRNYFTNYVLNNEWGPFIEYTKEFGKICYDAIIKDSEEVANEVVKDTSKSKTITGTILNEFGNPVFKSTDGSTLWIKDINEIIEKCAKEYVGKKVEIRIQIREV